MEYTNCLRLFFDLFSAETIPEEYRISNKEYRISNTLEPGVCRREGWSYALLVIIPMNLFSRKLYPCEIFHQVFRTFLFFNIVYLSKDLSIVLSNPAGYQEQLD